MIDKMRALVWLRNDLRIKDNVVLRQAIDTSEEVFFLYCFDTREFTETELGFPKTGAYRAQFMIESVTDLRKQLQSLGGDLIVRIGDPKTIVPEIATQLTVDKVLASKEVTYEEVQIEENIANSLPENVNLELQWQSTLFHPDDLPISIAELPEVFTNFRKIAEKKSSVRSTVSDLYQLPSTQSIEPGEIPTLQDLALESFLSDDRAAVSFEGGETAAWERLNHYFWKSECLSDYKQTRNGLVGADYSSKFSPWLAIGCISPRSIYEEVKKYEAEVKKNSSTYWLIFELIWRDYFRFISLKHGSSIFKETGIRNRKIKFRNHETTFRRWIDGATGEDFVDANMLELKHTGFMSNRGRQNVASYLVNDLNINWTWGAAYFESQLIDYDPCSNWGNWNYIAGVGNDPRQDRYFNIKSQAERYDPDGEYVNLWLA